MIRVNKINSYSNVYNFFILCTLMFILYVAYHVFYISNSSIGQLSVSDIKLINVKKVSSEVDTDIYKKIIDVTLPSANKYENKTKDKRNFIEQSIDYVIGIDIKKTCTILGQTTGIMKYNEKYITENKEKLAMIEGYDSELDLIESKKEDATENNKKQEVTDIKANWNENEINIPTNILDTSFQDITFLRKNYFTFEKDVNLKASDLPIKQWVQKNQKLNANIKGPKILIMHTHSHEAFIDSRAGNREDTVFGVGEELARMLREKYKIEVLHDTGEYDIVNGKLQILGAYTRAEPNIKAILKKYPSIQVIIDIHRDGFPNNVKLVKHIDNKPMAKFMFVNGICKKENANNVMEAIGINNPYVNDNLALSFKMALGINEKYPGLIRKTLIKPYRYNLHMLPKSLLMEVGCQNNTVEEVKNTMGPVADILASSIK